MNSLKITLNDEIRRFSFEKDENIDTFISFQKTVEQLFSLKNIENFEFYYWDEESDKITISTTLELDHFLSAGTQQPKRLSLEEKQNNSNYQVESNAPVTEGSSVAVDFSDASSVVSVDIPVVEEKEDIQFNSDVAPSKPDWKNMTKEERINFKAQRKENRVAQKSAKQQARFEKQQARCARRNQTSVVVEDKEDFSGASSIVSVDIPVVEEKEDIQFNSDATPSKPDWKNMTKEERINFKAQRKENRVAQKSAKQKERFAKQQQKSVRQQARCARRNQTSVVDKEHWKNMTKEERINFKAQRKENRVAQKSVRQKQRFAKQQARIRARQERVEA